LVFKISEIAQEELNKKHDETEGEAKDEYIRYLLEALVVLIEGIWKDNY